MERPNRYRQEPVAVVGFGCRLPGGNNSPQKLWDFLERGGIASTAVPETRFNVDGHYDGSLRPNTMRSPGAMCLENIDPAEFDSGFFEIGGNEALPMDPNQRQMLEVVYEGLENAGITLEKLDNQPVGCFVASFASDYADMQHRDPEDRPPNNALGVARTILANRLSHFLNVKGPSMNLDTACSGTLQGLDLACRYLNTGEINMAIIASSNLFLSPEHLMDSGSMGSVHSPSGLCHTFDAAADGYVKAEGVNAIIVKRLDAAIADRDPIRAIILGSATTSNGRTPGIYSPSAASQAMAIRAAYANANITDLNHTTYLECHGTGTQAGDPTEITAAGSVFAATRPDNTPLLVGSIKSNVGHSEPAAGNSGLLKVILSMENGFIPGTPTFINPSPEIDFAGNKVKAFRSGIQWPDNAPRRASINSFGVGGSNAHVIIESPGLDTRSKYVSSYVPTDDDFAEPDEDTLRPFLLVSSANDVKSLRAGIQSLGNHLLNPRVKVSLPDLAYTLSERRTKFRQRAFVTTHNTELDDKSDDWIVSKKSLKDPEVGFVFTGQGAQWPQMGKDLLRFFPWTRQILQELDDVLQGLSHPPSWTLLAELTEERTSQHLRQPEFSQPLATALQICLVAVLETWGVQPCSVVGHSSGEIAAAYAAGLLNRASAITAAFYRGKAAVLCQENDASDKNVGMLAVGLGSDAALEFVQKYAGQAWIACFNSPSSVTVSGKLDAVEALREEITAAGHFARLLQVDMAYHTQLMNTISDKYEELLSLDMGSHEHSSSRTKEVTMYSSVTARKQVTTTDAAYWKSNMSSPVLFDGALRAMLSDTENDVNFLIEIGPSGALSGPVSQVLKSIPSSVGSEIAYCSAWSRGSNAGKSLFDVAGRLWAAGHSIDLSIVNEYDGSERTIVDLPNYSWDHSVKYWHENAASKDWRYRKYITHDLLGSKILGTSWHAPSWRSRLNVSNLPYLMDHRMGGNIIMPGAGFIAMTVEAMYQKHCACLPAGKTSNKISRNELSYRFRDVRFNKALILEEGKNIRTLYNLKEVHGSKDWHNFTISTHEGDIVFEHCSGFVRVQDPIHAPAEGYDAQPLRFPQSAKLWYKSLREAGMDFGPSFQKGIEVEAISTEPTSGALVSLEPPQGTYHSKSYYPIHPAAMDGCLQTPSLILMRGDRAGSLLIPALIDDLVINAVAPQLQHGWSKADACYSGRGRYDQSKNWVANIRVYDTETGGLVARVTGMKYHKLDVATKPDPHTFHSPLWKPDIGLLTQDQVNQLVIQSDSKELDTVIDLIAFKVPLLRVLEINLDETDTSSVWLENIDAPVRAAYSEYTFGSVNPEALVHLETQHKEKGYISFYPISFENPTLDLPSDSSYDLIILKMSQATAATGLFQWESSLKPLLSKESFLLVLDTDCKGMNPTSETESLNVSTPESPHSESASLTPSITINESSSSASISLKSSGEESESPSSTPPLKTHGSSSPIMIAGAENSTVAFLSKAQEESHHVKSASNLIVASLSSSEPSTMPDSLQTMLEESGWETKCLTYPFPKPTGGEVIVVLDELREPIFTSISGTQWEAIKTIISWGNPILWVTDGAQGAVSNPEKAMAQGFFRVARQEDPSLKLTILDVESATSPSTPRAISAVLGLLREYGPVETEYMEQGGVLHVQRVVPDGALNDFYHTEEEGMKPAVKGLQSNKATVSLRAERIGTLQNLTWCELDTTETEVGAGCLEVDVIAIGANFKDVAITMGIVPDDEFKLGAECSGYVRRVGPGVTDFAVGDRICMLQRRCYSNRVVASVEKCHKIPYSMSFEEAATIPSVYLCSLYAMYHVGDLQEGQSVLIHSAAGGIGIACIELALHRKAEVYVTVGTEEKRQFLESKYGIPRSRMFSSRNADFAKGIMKATDGRGVNVLINSLTGELLDASWRILADGGNMVEIGKRDIIDRNTLSMEPFDRNCSFRAIDMSYSKHIDDNLIARLFNELFVLINAEHINPIDPITTFGFDDVVSALTLLRSGRHIGKIVISRGEKDDVQVPIRPIVPRLSLNPDVSYLVVGGLRGACGALAIHLAKYGARHLIVNSRSGISDEASARIVSRCREYGCEVIGAAGDVRDLDFVRNMFKSASRRIAGLIQGAMVLRDKPLETMTHDDYITAIGAKVEGTKNLHRASEEMQSPLEFFVMLSSISGVVGNKGQANYAAANTFLDAFASYRRSLGLRANTVDLGVIQDVGYVAEQDPTLEARFDTRLWTPIGEDMLRKILTYSILQQKDEGLSDLNQAEIITGVCHPLPSDIKDSISDARFSYFFNRRASNDSTHEKDESRGGNDPVDQAIQRFRLLQKSGADAATLKSACAQVLSVQMAKVFRIQGDLDVGRPLTAYGMDSLAAVELRNWVRMKLSAELTTLDITSASSLVALCEKVVSKLPSSETS